VKNKGFTLLELLVVLVLLSISLAVIIPRLGAGSDKRIVKTNARKLTAFFRLARYKAIFTQQKIRITIDEEKKTLSFNVGKEKKRFKIEDKKTTLKLEKPEEKSIYFYPNGTGTPFVISLKRGNYQLKVKFDAVKGEFILGQEEDSDT